MTTPLLVYPERNKQKIIDQKDKNSPIYHQPRLRRSQTRLNSDTKFFFHDFYIDKIEEYCPPSDTNVKKYKHITSPKKIVTTPKARAVTSLPFRRDQQTKTPKRVPIKRRNKSDTGIAPKRKRRALSTERSSERKTGKEVREEEEKEEKDDFSVDDAAKDNDSDVISLDVFEMNLDDPIILSDSDEEDVFEARLEEVLNMGDREKANKKVGHMGTESLDEASNTRRIQIHMAGIYQRIFDRNPGLEKDMKENPHLVEQMLQQIPEAMANAIKADKKFGSVVHEEHKGPQEYEEIDGDITRIISMPERVPVFPIMIDREDREIAEKEKRERMAAQMEILRGQYLAARSYYARFPPFPYPPPYQMPQMPHMPPHMPPFMPPHFQPSYPPFGPR